MPLETAKSLSHELLHPSTHLWPDTAITHHSSPLCLSVGTVGAFSKFATEPKVRSSGSRGGLLIERPTPLSVARSFFVWPDWGRRISSSESASRKIQFIDGKVPRADECFRVALNSPESAGRKLCIVLARLVDGSVGPMMFGPPCVSLGDVTTTVW